MLQSLRCSLPLSIVTAIAIFCALPSRSQTEKVTPCLGCNLLNQILKPSKQGSSKDSAPLFGGSKYAVLDPLMQSPSVPPGFPPEPETLPDDNCGCKFGYVSSRRECKRLLDSGAITLHQYRECLWYAWFIYVRCMRACDSGSQTSQFRLPTSDPLFTSPSDEYSSVIPWRRPIKVDIYSRRTDPAWIHQQHSRSPVSPDYGKHLYYYPVPDHSHQLYGR
jgi:hypothetical protein